MEFGHTIIYVKDVSATVEFYEKAFGVKKAFIDETGMYAQMETGTTALGFASEDFASSNIMPFNQNALNASPAGFEISFTTKDLDTAFQKALSAGCFEVAKPQEKPWGQTVAYLRDLNGILVELATPIHS